MAPGVSGENVMSGQVHYRLEDRIAVLTIDNPPVNALSHPIRIGLVEALERADSDDDVDAVVIAASGQTFPAGADITEFGPAPKHPWLPEVCNRIENCRKPVIAAIHGTALGGGFEVAMAAHYRLALETARVGLPEVTLGVLPGAGGTQRAPRLAAAKHALDLMLSGRQVGADAAADMGLLDGVVEGDLHSAAVSYAEALVAEGVGPRPTRDVTAGLADASGFAEVIANRRKLHAASPLEAPRRIIDCVEAALVLPFDVGLEYERAAFDDLVASDQSAALRHMFFAERKAWRFPGLDKALARRVEQVGVVGGGTMGTGIAVALLQAGFSVVMLERDEAALEAAVKRIVDTLDRLAKRERVTSDARDRMLDKLRGALDYAQMAEVDLAIEAVFEDLDAKKAVFRALDGVLKNGAVLASNTSYLDIDLLAAGTGRPSDVVGLHFFAPANIMRLLEIVVGAATSPEVVATALQIARRLGKTPIRSEVSDGFVANRLLTAYRRAAEELLEDGAGVAKVDGAMRDFGFPLGPFQVADLAGLDISWARRKRLAATRDPAERYVAIGDRLCEAGRLGQKSGKGYYLYKPGSHMGAEDPEVEAIISAEQARKGIDPRAFKSDEISRRCLLAMANEGARVVQEGVALRPSDIDVAMVHGFGFPRWRGGPMKWADTFGLLRVQRLLEELVEEDPALWTPSPLFAELVKNGKTFDSLSA